MENNGRPLVTRNTHVRIDFVIREVCPDGSVPEDDLRFIRFGDDVKPGDVRDFFDRTSAAMGLMFQTVGAQTLRFIEVGPNKIQCIKTLREVTGLGLKDAKDLVEASPGTAIMVIHDVKDAERVRHAFSQAGAKVETRAYHISDTDGPRGNLPSLASYNGCF